MKFEMPVLTVSDIGRSREFYQKVLGLEVEFDFGENISFRDSISLWDRERASEIVFGERGRFEPYNGAKPVELYFETDDLESVSSMLAKLDVELIHPLREEPWGQRNIRFFDPDRYVIEVGEPIENVVIRMDQEGLDHNEISVRSQMPIELVGEILSSGKK